MALHRGETKDKALGAKDANINLAVSELTAELDDRLAGFKERLAILKRTALERIEAREALASEASTSLSASQTRTQSESRVSILPIEEETLGGAGEGSGGIIGKGKEQVLEALSMAEAAASTASAQVAGKVESVVSGASEAVLGHSSPTGAAAHLESIAHNVEQRYASVVSNAGGSRSYCYSIRQKGSWDLCIPRKRQGTAGRCVFGHLLWCFFDRYRSWIYRILYKQYRLGIAILDPVRTRGKGYRLVVSYQRGPHQPRSNPISRTIALLCISLSVLSSFGTVDRPRVCHSERIKALVVDPIGDFGQCALGYKGCITSSRGDSFTRKRGRIR